MSKTLCEECQHLVVYEDVTKWPDKCGKCGRPTEEIMEYDMSSDLNSVKCILVCGGRNYDDYEKVYESLANELNRGAVKVIHGGAKGADSLAEKVCSDLGIETEVYQAYWGKYGKSAGAIRNQRMLKKGEPDAVFAFPGGRGTFDMVKKAEKAGVEVEFPADD